MSNQIRQSPPRLSKAGALEMTDKGNVLVLTLIVSIVMILGLGALASRSQFGLLGAIFQSKNREARDVAESALHRFINKLNMPQNRYLLIAGTGVPWTSSDGALLNPCTKYSSSPPFAALSAPPTSQNLSTDIQDYYVGGFKNLDGSSNVRQYKIEKIVYLDSNRQEIKSGPDLSAKRSIISSGSDVSLIRVTVQGKVTRNGRVSYSRIAREYEIVPKCCFRSFGRNKNGAGEWGRDERSCAIEDPNKGGAGIVGALDGDGSLGSKNALNIVGEDGKPISTALCWAGNESITGSDLVGTPNQECKDGSLKLGSTVSLVPQKFNYKAPKPRFDKRGCLNTVLAICSPASPSDLPAAPPVAPTAWGPASSAENLKLNTTYASASPGNWILGTAVDGSTFAWIAGYPLRAVDPSATGTDAVLDAVQWFKAPSSGFTPGIVNQALITMGKTNNYLYFDGTNVRLSKDFPNDGVIVTDSSGNPACYAIKGGMGGVGTSPYAEVNCNISQIDIKGGTGTVYVDTSNAKINLHFTNPAVTDYIKGGGNAVIQNIHNPPGGVNTPITWDVFKYKCIDSGTSTTDAKDPLCSSGTNRPYDTGELFNMYASGNGTFSFVGGASGVGFNLYAPFANVSLKGGGGSDSNYMGRIWADQITMTGSISIKTLGALPPTCSSTGCPDVLRFIYDMKARSYTQASGFGL